MNVDPSPSVKSVAEFFVIRTPPKRQRTSAKGVTEFTSGASHDVPYRVEDWRKQDWFPRARHVNQLLARRVLDELQIELLQTTVPPKVDICVESNNLKVLGDV